MTSEPKVRADISGENIYVHIKYENESEMIYGLIAPTYKVKANEKINELIASKINAPDPIEVLTEIISKYERNEGNEKYDDGYLLGLAQAIDQLRKGE